jgi:hypothetical protein
MGSEQTALGAASEAVKFVKSEQGEMLTKPFLDLCRLHLSIIGTICGSNLIVVPSFFEISN